MIKREYFILHGVAQRFALPALGRAAGRRPTGKMLRRRKRLGIAPESPASGAPKKIARDHFIREKRERKRRPAESILGSGKHASRTKQWRALHATPVVHHGFRSN